MLMRTVKRLAPMAALALLLPAIPSRAAETAETVLIRQTLEKDRSGLRRGDAELVAAAVADNFVHYDARGYMDPAGWTIPEVGVSAYTKALEADLAARRYDISRTVTLLHVYTDKAFVTTVDSGWVQDRASGERQVYASSCLWLFRKYDEEWLATALISDLGDTTAGPYEGAASPPPEAIREMLGEEAAGWSDGSPGSVLGHFDEEFVAYDSYGSSNPAKLVIIFADLEEFDEWLTDRLQRVNYDVERRVVTATLSEGGDEAIAISDERVSVTHQLGTASSSRERRVVWMLSRRSGSWKVANMLLHMKAFQ